MVISIYNSFLSFCRARENSRLFCYMGGKLVMDKRTYIVGRLTDYLSSLAGMIMSEDSSLPLLLHELTDPVTSHDEFRHCLLTLPKALPSKYRNL